MRRALLNDLLRHLDDASFHRAAADRADDTAIRVHQHFRANAARRRAVRFHHSRDGGGSLFFQSLD